MIVDKEKLKTEEKDSSEPKAGDIVEAFYAKMERWDCDGWKYLGVKSSKGAFVCEWEKTGEVNYFSEIRLPQKSEVESKAKEILNKWYLPSSTTDAHDLEMAISLIKWGQQNPDKK